MDFIKVQLDRISKQLGGLSASQKMLTVTFVVIMAMTLFYWARYAGEAEMEPVLDQAMSAEEISRIKTYLQGRNITARVMGDKVLVPVDRKFEVLADLGYAQLLPRDTQNGIDQLMKASNLFASPVMTDAMLNKAKETMLTQILRRFPLVREANVIIDARERRAFEQSVRSSATVNLLTRDGSGGKQLISAAADLVAGSVAGLTRGRVTVILDGKSFRLPDKDSMAAVAGDDLLELQQVYEQRYSDKIRNQVSYMRGVVVSVHVEVDAKTTREEIEKVDPTNAVAKESRTVETSDESTNGGRGGEPGMATNVGGANQGMSIDGAVPAASVSTSSKTETEFAVKIGRTATSTFTPAGKHTVLGAAVRLPRSYYITALKLSKDLDEAALQTAIKSQLESIRNEVVTCTGLKPENVSVETYMDELADISSPATAGAGGGGSMTTLLGGRYKEIGTGLLAVLSLFLLMAIVRKGAPPVAVAVEDVPREVGPLHAGEDVAGEATETNPLLDGMELDEDAIKTQQMLTQVQDLVKENPEAAANMVKRWLNR